MTKNITKVEGNKNDYTIDDREPDWEAVMKRLKDPNRKPPTTPFTQEEWDRVVRLATGFADMRYFDSLYRWHYQKPLPEDERKKIIAMFEKRGRKDY